MDTLLFMSLFHCFGLLAAEGFLGGVFCGGNFFGNIFDFRLTLHIKCCIINVQRVRKEFIMKSVNVTVRLDEGVKKDFDEFCDNVGMNVTTAINMFIKATLRTRQLPFAVIDSDPKLQSKLELLEVIESIQKQSVINGTDNMSLDEINGIISECRVQA
ncbi:MAG: type II toxin-antitoxin system RelB/DinJ family antitoxin [Oscillospiraceae bacterium]|nr:type II toxin-antitoxin system RelB/DinJ family antitoxin [Oscillospiraceae bacterium]